MTKITVVTVTYNANAYLEETIKSVIEQDYPHIEYIIIDGGSSDGTLDIIKKYKKYISYWVSEKDNGIYDAMNKAIDVASGEWINFLNAGDSFCDVKTISKVVECFSEDAELVCGDVYFVDEKNNKIYQKSKKLHEAFDGMFCFHQSLFTKTSIMKKYKFNNYFKIAGDYDFVLKCYANGHKFKFLDFAIANFLSGGISEQNKILARVEDMFIQSRYLKNISDIYKSKSFQALKSHEHHQNYHFSIMLNRVYLTLNALKLKANKIAIYGYGTFGKLVHKELGDVVVCVDANADSMEDEKIIHPKKLKEFDFDYVIVCVLGREEEIVSYVTNSLKIDSSKIITFEL